MGPAWRGGGGPGPLAQPNPIEIWAAPGLRGCGPPRIGQEASGEGGGPAARVQLSAPFAVLEADPIGTLQRSQAAGRPVAKCRCRRRQPPPPMSCRPCRLLVGCSPPTFWTCVSDPRLLHSHARVPAIHPRRRSRRCSCRRAATPPRTCGLATSAARGCCRAWRSWRMRCRSPWAPRCALGGAGHWLAGRWRDGGRSAAADWCALCRLFSSRSPLLVSATGPQHV